VILLVSGSLRAGSVNSAVVRTLAALGDEIGMETSVYAGMGELPWFDPDLDREPLPPGVGPLRAAVGAARAVLFCTPEYAGALPGSFKNLLDWTVGGGEMYRKPVAWVNVSASPTGAAGAHASLATVLDYLDADVIEAACVPIPVTRAVVGDDGLITDPATREQISRVLAAIAGHVSAA
jgi:NAD(P)H-dependent FMN reductase